MGTTCSCFVLDWCYATFSLETVMTKFSQALKPEGKTQHEFSTKHISLLKLKKKPYLLTSTAIKFTTKRSQELDNKIILL